MDPKQLPQNVTDTLNATPPSQAAFDALGTTTPSAADTQQEPFAAPSTAPGFATFANARGAQSVADAYKRRLVQKVDEHAAASPNPSAPGAWSRSLVAGALSALSDASEDVATAQQMAAKAPKGVRIGVAGALGNVATAKRERLNKEQTEAVLRAHTTLQMHQITQQMQIASENHQLEMDKNSQASIDDYSKFHDKVGEMPFSQYQQMVEAMGGHAKFDAEYIAIPKGRIPQTSADGKPAVDDQGRPIQEANVTLFRRQVGQTEVPEKTAARARAVGITDFPAAGSSIGKDVLTERIAHITALENANAALDEAHAKALTSDEKARSVDALARIDKHILDIKDDPIGSMDALVERNRKGIESLQATRAAAEQNGKTDVMNQIDQMIKSANQEIQDANTVLSTRFTLEDLTKRREERIGNDALQKDLDKAHGEEAASIAAGLQAKIDNPNTPQEMLPKLNRQLLQANAQAKATQDYDVEKKRREAEAELKASEGDISEVIDMALKYQKDPDTLFSRFKGQKQKMEFLAEMHRRDPNWSEAEYKKRYNTEQSYAAGKPGEVAKRALNTFAGHTGDANNLIQTLHNTRSPLLSTPLNKWKEDVLGQPQIIQYRVALQAAGENYIDFLLNNRAKHESDDDLVKVMTSVNSSPAMAQGMLRQMANTIAIRARAQNKDYRDIMKKDIPNFLDPDTENVLRTFGIDPKEITKQNQSDLINKTSETQNLPKPADGMARVKLPSGKFMDFQANSQAYKQAIANGALAVNE